MGNSQTELAKGWVKNHPDICKHVNDEVRPFAGQKVSIHLDTIEIKISEGRPTCFVDVSLKDGSTTSLNVAYIDTEDVRALNAFTDAPKIMSVAA